MPIKVLSSLDAARIQWYHFKAIIVAGMGLFTDAYDLFCIAPVMKMISHVYYHGDSINTAVLSTSYAIALLGTATGQLVFGYLGDRVGRRRVYGLCLVIMIISSFGCGFSVCTTRRSCVMVSLGFFRFILGLGIGGDYPLSATIMSEFANKRTRGAFIAAVFSMQGLGILVSSAVTMAVCVAFKRGGGGGLEEEVVPPEADVAWRLILMIGALPAALTFYWRMLMPETARSVQNLSFSIFSNKLISIIFNIFLLLALIYFVYPITYQNGRNAERSLVSLYIFIGYLTRILNIESY